ncbi:hypothetical protein DFJ43DRAFT_595000 [Lentinula guzmanii]|uniref:C3H1-type domain-containing protein n=2 Tax=Lentinula TaxID=5352 RepID=A0AA38J647_9AGAR|nr:hypothetical protein DFJ43DRAFT_595000 [Lentinula guzmanii]
MSSNTVSESRVKLSFLRRAGSSIQQADRIHRTNLPALAGWIKKLTLEDRMEKNWGIERRNAERREIQAMHVAGLSDTEGSPVASLYSITSEEWDSVRKSPTLFQRLKEWIPARYLGWMTQMNEAEMQAKLPSQTAVANPAADRANSKLMDPIVEHVEDPTAVTEVDIPHQLHEMAKYHRYLPLPIFTDNNLLYVRNHLSKIKTEKIRLPNTTEKISILLLSDILDQLNIREVSVNEGLTYAKFEQAAANYYRFETERDPDGHAGNRSTWTKSHFLFWTNRSDAEDTFPFWKPLELEMRQARQDRNLQFDLNSYRLTWSRVLIAQDYSRLHPHPSSSSAPHSNSLSGSDLGKKRPAESDIPPRPFSKGGKSDSRESCCLGCGQAGHPAGDHQGKHGPLLWARWVNSSSGYVLGIPNGPETRICYQWNLRGSCKSKSCPNAHVCTFCGSSAHHAFAFQCRTRPN